MQNKTTVLTVILGVLVVVLAIGVGWAASLAFFPRHTVETSAQSATEEENEEPSPAVFSESEDSQGSTSSASMDERCDPGFVSRSPGFKGNSAVKYCDGSYLLTGVPNTDSVSIALWERDQWKALEKTGEDPTSLYPCYHQETLEMLTFPREIINSVTLCSDGRQQRPQYDGNGNRLTRYVEYVGLGEAKVADISAPQCDGRYILIHDSVIDNGNDVDLHQHIAGTILAHKTWKYTYPGQCSSLRAQIDGRDIYPIYEDFGTDRAAMCAAQAASGGNGRTLNNNGDFSDPCR